MAVIPQTTVSAEAVIQSILATAQIFLFLPVADLLRLCQVRHTSQWRCQPVVRRPALQLHLT